MHALANLNLIRNWVGQSTSQDFYDLCDKYGILLWDEFFQPNPSDGPNPTDLATYIANVRDKIVRFRNHPPSPSGAPATKASRPRRSTTASAPSWLSSNPHACISPAPPKATASTPHGPYHWRTPREFYVIT